MMKEQTSQFQAKLDHLERVGAFISHFMREAHLADDQIYNFGVAVDEHFTNLVEHAFPGNPDAEITITCRDDGTKAQVLIIDDSAGFDPRQHQKPNVEAQAIYELPPGGFGNYFICQLMDEVDYIHQPHIKNVLILTMYKHQQPQQNEGDKA
jgi:anti-sigma regulatory factor (Ser/Thr protein kinase)